MYILEKFRREIEKHSSNASGQILAQLLEALEKREAFHLNKLYSLSYSQFELAMELLEAWRLARHYPQSGPEGEG